MAKDKNRTDPISIRFKPDEREAVDRAAAAARRTPSDWVRVLAVEAAEGLPAGARIVRDQPYLDALARLLAAHPMGTAGSIIRACVLACDVLETADQKPFRVLVPGAVDAPADEPKPAGRRRGSGGG